ncbi:MAG TPA: hypothetical protein VH760_10980 [Gaiellaceae bacterium]|jgi:hypothetical protein
METTFCSLSVAVGNDEECPRGWCAFWEAGGAVVGPGCAIQRLGVDLHDPELARYLLDLRRELESVRDAEAARAALERLSELAPADVSGA